MLKIKKKKKKYILNSILNILTNNLVNFQTRWLSQKHYHVNLSLFLQIILQNYEFLLINEFSLFFSLFFNPNITFTQSLKFPG